MYQGMSDGKKHSATILTGILDWLLILIADYNMSLKTRNAHRERSDDKIAVPVCDHKTLPADTEDCKTLWLKQTLNLH